MIEYNTLIVLIGTSLLGLSAGVVGVFAVLRRRALIGDALGHATLPGLWIAFWLTGQRSLPILLTGALVSGVLGIWVIALLRKTTRLKEDVAIALVLSVFFGAGIVIQKMLQARHSSGASGLNDFLLGHAATINRDDVQLLVSLTLACLAVVAILFKELKMVAFDAAFAQVQGWPAGRLDFLLMLLIAAVILAGIPAVGVLLSASLLVIPPAAARFWTQRLAPMLALSGGMGMVAAFVGTFLSARFENLAAGPTIVVVAGAGFLVSFLFGPHGASDWMRPAPRLEEPAP